tara:strand:+ start:445 stop:1563 length:1119 start_codon:yes stop_codon:yes gene_type:complete
MNIKIARYIHKINYKKRKINMTKKLSTIVSGLLLSTTITFAADSIDNAFKEGKVSGSLMGYSKVTEKSDTLTTGTIGLNYSTASYMGLSANVGFFAGHEVEGSATSVFSDKSIMNEANLTYAMDGFALTAGRQAIDLEWMGDYHEAVVAGITVIPNTTIVLGYSDKQAVAAEDEITAFSKINGSKGAYVADVKYGGISGVEINPYYYSVPDLANWYGAKVTYSSDMFGALAHYAASSEDVSTTNDGSMLALEASTALSGVSLAAGYIKTDKDGGIGSMSAVGDNYEPMDDGSAIYLADAKMVYGTVAYSVAGIDLGAAYAQTKAASLKDKELNLTADYSFTDSLSASLLYVDINAETMSDSTYGSVLVSYSF